MMETTSHSKSHCIKCLENEVPEPSLSLGFSTGNRRFRGTLSEEIHVRAPAGLEKTGHGKTENARIVMDIRVSAKIRGEVFCFCFYSSHGD